MAGMRGCQSLSSAEWARLIGLYGVDIIPSKPIHKAIEDGHALALVFLGRKWRELEAQAKEPKPSHKGERS